MHLSDFASLAGWQLVVIILLVTAACELVTCLFRFGFRLRARRDLAWLGRWTGGIRIHHGYLGIPLLVASYALVEPRAWTVGLAIAGWSLLLSDAVHHFVVLPLTVGRTEFDLTFPSAPEIECPADSD